MNTFTLETVELNIVVYAFVGVACTGGVADARMADAMTIYGQRLIHMIRLIQMNRQELRGQTGINQGNRLTGVEVVFRIQNITVRDSQSMKVALWKSVLIVTYRYSRTDI